MRGLITAVIFASTLAIAGPADAAGSDAPAIALLLGGFEEVPSEQQLLPGRTEARVVDALIELASDRSQPLHVRQRATAFLGSFASERTRAAVHGLLARDEEHPWIIRAALSSAARMPRADAALIARWLE